MLVIPRNTPIIRSRDCFIWSAADRLGTRPPSGADPHGSGFPTGNILPVISACFISASWPLMISRRPAQPAQAATVATMRTWSTATVAKEGP